MLRLFYPYLPKDRHTVPGLKKSLAIPAFTKQLLRGEAQVQCSRMHISNDACCVCVSASESATISYHATTVLPRRCICLLVR